MKTRDRILLGVVAVIASLAAGWLLVAQPKRDEIAKLDEQISGVQTQLAGASSRAAEYRAARKALLENPKAFANAGRALPNRAAMPELLRTLNRNAKRANVEMTQMTTGNGAQGTGTGATPGIGNVGLSLTFEGDFLAMRRYLASLQKLVDVSTSEVNARGRLLALNKVSFAPGSAGKKLTAKVDASVYVLQAGALTVGAAPADATGAAPAATTAAPATPAPATTPTPAGASG